MNWSIQQDGDTWVVYRGEEPVGTYDTPADALAAMDEMISAAEQPADIEAPEGSPGTFTIPILVPAHGTTGDGRRFVLEGGGWRTPPLAMMFQNHTEVGHFGAVWSGTITQVYRNDDGSLGAKGFYAANSDGQAHHDAVAGGMRGVSMDASAEEYEIEGMDSCYECDEPVAESDPVIVFTAWTIMGATATPFPAFAEAHMVNDDSAALAAGGVIEDGPIIGESDAELVIPREAQTALTNANLAITNGTTTFATTTPGNTITITGNTITAGSTGGSVSDKAWDGSASRFTDEQYKRAAAACRGESDAPKSDCFAPHHEPDGTVNRNGVHAAAQRFGAINAPSSAKATAAAHLRSHYTKDLKEDPPDSIKANHNHALVACAAADLPPAAWFENPGLERETRLTVTDDGRVFGHLATWRDANTGKATCHIGMAGRCVQPPRSASNYAYFNMGTINTAEGTTVLAGQITMDGSHASTGRGVSLRDAAAHYENTGTVVADVRAGEDEFGIWLAGALRADVAEDEVRRLRAAKISGDWRPIGNASELVAALSVNVPGFPNPAIAASGEPRNEIEWARVDATTGQVLALVASAVIPERDPMIEWQAGVMQRLARVERLLSPLRGVVAREVDATIPE